eukprot:CAMPEP_0172441392 /NCGR_PEP_ID=MMETSP1065-20121228/1943_1 /TAXON_ID=265537 /ORGANISM="Amphiprora paludosa, Strain CCMP125" /LENGTH=31 /DNA_ID= /DNA_START= /DNA_END= /DNA_ORIENTATION=
MAAPGKNGNETKQRRPVRKRDMMIDDDGWYK